MKKTFITTAMVLVTCIAPFATTNGAKNPTVPAANARDKKDLGSGDFVARDKKDLGSGDFVARDKKDLGSGDFVARDKKDLGSGDFCCQGQKRSRQR